MALTTFVSNTDAVASEVNGNFSRVLKARTVAGDQELDKDVDYYIGASGSEKFAKVKSGNEGAQFTKTLGEIEQSSLSGFFRQVFINGDFQVWQTPGPITVADAASGYFGDIWRLNNSCGATITGEQDKIVYDTANTKISALKMTGVSDNFKLQFCIEGDEAYKLTGRSISLGFWIKAGGTITFLTPSSVNIQYKISTPSTTKNDFSALTEIVAATSFDVSKTGLSTTLEQFKKEGISLGTSDLSKGLLIEIIFPDALFASTGQTLYMTAVQGNQGLTLASFDSEDYDYTLNMVKRFYNRYDYDSASNEVIAIAHTLSTGDTGIRAMMDFDVEMVKKPTGSTIDYANIYFMYGDSAAVQFAGDITFSSTKKNTNMTATVNTGAGTSKPGVIWPQGGGGTCSLIFNARLL